MPGPGRAQTLTSLSGLGFRFPGILGFGVRAAGI